MEPNVLTPLFQALTPNKYLEDRITGAILSEEEIADAASPALSDIRRHMRQQSARIRESLQKVISSPAYSKYLREPIVTIRQGRYVVPVKSECKNEVPGLVHDVSATGSTFFIEPMSAVNANNALRAGNEGEEGNRADSGGAVCRSGGASGGHFRELPAVNPAGCDLCQIQAVLPNASRSAYYE